jgi:uncharacterized membrane protein
MNHARLHSLTDGIFAIVMTLMVLELKLPSLKISTNHGLWTALVAQRAIFISYFVSFAVLFIYWRAHNFVITFFAKNIDLNLLTMNGIFLFLVGLIPFSTQLAGTFNKIPLAVSLYALNIILIGLSVIWMRYYIERADHIDNVSRTPSQRRAALIRTTLPIIFAAIAIPFSFISTGLADIILLVGVFYNFLNNAADLTDKFLIMPLNKLLRSSL